MTEDQVLQLLKESIITPGFYRPSGEFSQGESVAINLGEQTIMLLGYSDDEASHAVVDRLLQNRQFIELVEYVFGYSAALKKSIVTNSKFLPSTGESLTCLTESPQGSVEDGTGEGMLAAILPGARQDFCVGLCVTNSIMLDMFPEAKPLSMQVTLI